jgi:hypothetical protein
LDLFDTNAFFWLLLDRISILLQISAGAVQARAQPDWKETLKGLDNREDNGSGSSSQDKKLIEILKH